MSTIEREGLLGKVFEGRVSIEGHGEGYNRATMIGLFQVVGIGNGQVRLKPVYKGWRWTKVLFDIAEEDWPRVYSELEPA